MCYVQVQFPNGIANQFRADFDDAAELWNDIIRSGQPGFTFGVPVNVQGLCGFNVVLNAGETIDGVVIFANVANIDGPGGTLGRAGPCGVANNFAILGTMKFDSSDIDTLAGAGNFEAVVRHEMGHVLGLGTLWSLFGLILRPCPNAGVCTTNPKYLGVQGNLGFQDVGGSGKAPIENTGGAGTRNGHWRESVFDNELMTGFLNPGFNPTSRLTVRALRDLGFSTRANRAEAYTLPREGEIEDDVNKFEMVGDIIDIEPVDMSEYMIENQGRDSAGALGEQGVLVAVVIATGLALVALIAAVAIRRRRNRSELPETA